MTQSKRTAKRLQWTEIHMLAVLDIVLNKHLSENKAVALHEVLPSTLKNRLSGCVIQGLKPCCKPSLTK